VAALQEGCFVRNVKPPFKEGGSQGANVPDDIKWGKILEFANKELARWVAPALYRSDPQSFIPGSGP
jgi:hypothetical protein